MAFEKTVYSLQFRNFEYISKKNKREDVHYTSRKYFTSWKSFL